MGLFSNLGLGDTLSGVLGSLQSAAMPALINAVLEKTQYHDINGLVAALQKGGLGPQVQSWLGPAATCRSPRISSKPSSAIRSSRTSRGSLGLPVDATLKILAQYLPELVDKASPNGTLQSHNA